MITICGECPHCQEEIEIHIVAEKIKIGEEGETRCPACFQKFDYEIRVLTTTQEETTTPR